ncbi:MAG: bifunctional folylpolyglutamate synthase/dihydrofolate synthase, partial [Limisphaerales bacterium]
MTYSESISWLQGLGRFGLRPGLDTTLRLAAAAGDPHRRLRFIHVAGTNGKGSTCAFLESICRHAGRRVGLYTSPHLVSFRERIQLNRVLIPEADLARLATLARGRIEAEAAAGPATLFEVATVMALEWFAEQRAELVIWETGLGGRLDATNIVTPLASVITNIGWDHMDVLGDSLAKIAAEKAGIIKPGVPVVTGAEG